MIRYANTGGDSGVEAYEIGETYIDVKFSDGSCYRYSYASAGREHVEAMKQLAKRGEGLNSYIMRKCRQGYESKC